MEAGVFKDCLRKPTLQKVAYKQLAKFAKNFKDGLHKPASLEDGLHAPMETGNFKKGLHKPTFHVDGLQAPVEAGERHTKVAFTLLECHDIGGKNADGGYGGPPLPEPFGDDVSKITCRSWEIQKRIASLLQQLDGPVPKAHE